MSDRGGWRKEGELKVPTLNGDADERGEVKEISAKVR
jgi:hypothetical protein